MTVTNELAIEYKNLCKCFPGADKNAVDHVTAKVNAGEFVTILGSSGCGKTTLLRLTNKLLEVDEGEILVRGESVASQDPVELRRSMGYVIQQAGLFPHLNVRDNITAIPKLIKCDKKEMIARADELLELVGLEPKKYADRYPRQLSGGQQQRVGLARALVLDPDIMLLDEPFGSVDAITRLRLQDEIKKIHGGLKKTFLFVTHDIHEAMKLGSRVMIMNDGKLLQFDEPIKIARNPADAFVESLISSAKASEGYLG